MAYPLPAQTPKSLDLLDGTGFTPKPTDGPTLRGANYHDLTRRYADAPISSSYAAYFTCGWISGILQECDDGIYYDDCLFNSTYSAIGCCEDAYNCNFYTTCVAYSNAPASCSNVRCSDSTTKFCDYNSPECGKVTYSSGTDQYSSWYCTDSQVPVQTLEITSDNVLYTNLPRSYTPYYFPVHEPIGEEIRQHLGIVIGGGVGLLIVIALFIWFMCWRRNRRRQQIAAGAEAFRPVATGPMPSPSTGRQSFPMNNRHAQGHPPPQHQYWSPPADQAYYGRGYNNQPYDPTPAYRQQFTPNK